DEARTPFGIAPRLPWRWLRHHVDPALGGDGEQAEAQESTELLHASVVLPPTPPLGGADGEPDLVAVLRAELEALIEPDGSLMFGEALEDDGALVFEKACELGALDILRAQEALRDRKPHV